MLSWVSETLFGIISWIPNWLYADDTPRYFIVRGMLGMGLIVLILLVVSLRPHRVVAKWYRQHRGSKKKS